MRLTIPHFFDFGTDRALVGDDLVRPDAWDAIRTSAGPFGLPGRRSEWEAAADEPSYRAKASGIADVARSLGATTVCSYGVGAAFVELNLSRTAPELELVCTDYAPRTVARLASLFPEARVLEHDLRHDETVAADLQVLHRVDSEFTDDELRLILARFEQPVLFVPSEFLTLRSLCRELLTRAKRTATRAGYLRTRDAFEALWAQTHTQTPVQVGPATAYLLVRAGERTTSSTNASKSSA
jgi:hypothetical protein